jgi:hypothetical protein
MRRAAHGVVDLDPLCPAAHRAVKARVTALDAVPRESEAEASLTLAGAVAIVGHARELTMAAEAGPWLDAPAGKR